MTITTTSTANLSSLDLSGLRLTHAQFEQLCEHNRDVRLELTAEGYLTTMAPTFGESSKRNFDLIRQVEIYRLNKDREILLSPTHSIGEDILVGFELDLTTIW